MLVLMDGDHDLDLRCSREWVRDRDTLWRDRELDLLRSQDRDRDLDFLWWIRNLLLDVDLLRSRD